MFQTQPLLSVCFCVFLFVGGVASGQVLDVNQDGFVGPEEVLELLRNWKQAADVCACTDSWSLEGNSGTDPSQNFLGTVDNQALELRVQNLRGLRIEPTGFTPNLIGGSGANSVLPGVGGATIGGGGASGGANQARADYATVSGGFSNIAGGEVSTVGGGEDNRSLADYSCIQGGQGNRAQGAYSTISGGIGNRNFAQAAVISGGQNNFVQGGLVMRIRRSTTWAPWPRISMRFSAAEKTIG